MLVTQAVFKITFGLGNYKGGLVSLPPFLLHQWWMLMALSI